MFWKSLPIPVYSLAAASLALAMGLLVAVHQWRTECNGMERWYFASYVRSQLPLQHSGATKYRIIELIDDRHPEQSLATATSEDAELLSGAAGTLNLRYKGEWAHRANLRAVVRTIAIDDEVMHGWLQEKVFDYRSIDDLVRLPVEKGSVVATTCLLAGFLFSMPADLKRIRQARLSHAIQANLIH